MVADDGQWLGVPEAAHLLGVAPDTIYRLVRSGTLPALRFPVRIRRVDLDGAPGRGTGATVKCRRRTLRSPGSAGSLVEQPTPWWPE